MWLIRNHHWLHPQTWILLNRFWFHHWSWLVLLSHCFFWRFGKACSKTLASYKIASSWFWPMDTNGAEGFGLVSESVRLVVSFDACSAIDREGILTWDGKKLTVSTICSPRVSLAYTIRHLCCSKDGLRYHPYTLCVSHVICCSGFHILWFLCWVAQLGFN